MIRRRPRRRYICYCLDVDIITDGGAETARAALAALQEEIAACRACVAAGLLGQARPIPQGGRHDDRVMVVGQAPGARSDTARRHFSGPAGALLERWFTAAGFPPGFFRQRVYLTSLTRCFPGKNRSGKGDRAPSPAELALCRPFLERELQIVRPRLVVPVGSMAIEYFLGRVRLADVVGTLQQWADIPILPLPHTSPVSRWLNAPENQARVRRALELLAECRVRLELA